MEDWKLEIKKVNNGYILKGRFGNSENITEQVIEDNNIDNSKLEGMKNVLYEVMDYFAVYYSKHNKENLIIKIEENKI